MWVDILAFGPEVDKYKYGVNRVFISKTFGSFFWIRETAAKGKMKIPTLSVFAVFALLGMALGMGGYGSYGYGASYIPVPVHPGYGGSGGVGDGGILYLLGFFFLIMLLLGRNTTTTGTTTTTIG